MTSAIEGRVALVSGGGGGIGSAVALLLAEEGVKVAIADIDEGSGDEIVRQIRAKGGEATFIRTDATNDANVSSTVREVVSRFGRIDILSNCAGGSIAADGSVTDVDLSVWDHTISLDLKGTFLFCRHTIPAIVEAGGGSVINMTSWLGLVGGPRRNVYSTAKGGIISLTRTLAAEFAHKGVRVNAVAPGAIRTERALRKNQQSEGSANSEAREYRARLVERYPFSVGDPVDIAHIVAFLASPKSRMITGAVIPADGGRSAYL